MFYNNKISLDLFFNFDLKLIYNYLSIPYMLAIDFKVFICTLIYISTIS